MTGTERKVFQKYYPPDFDPSKIPRDKGQRNRQFIQRVMAPYNMQCNTCHEYIYKGKKFNMRRETAEGEFYLGLKIFRFYFRCPNCLAEITFKTDLENCDYQQEHGATRLFEAFKLYQQEEKAKETQEEEDKKDPMKMLEKRTKMSRAEMEEMRKLEEIQELKRKQEAALRKQEEEDEKFVRSLYGRTEDGQIIRRIKDEDEDDYNFPGPSGLKTEIKKESEEDQPNKLSSKPAAGFGQNKRSTVNSQKELLSKIVVPKKKKLESPQPSKPPIKLKEEMDSDEKNNDKKAEATPTAAQPIAANSFEKPVDALKSICDYGSDTGSE
uniref:Splicing factor YJU2 n=1 Tax=Syphacia muris TaxID=451379 RepID=A0A0N5APX0_9BILA